MLDEENNDQTQQKTNSDKKPIVIEICEVKDLNNDGATDLADVELLLQQDANTSRPLKGDANYSAGDFRSAECIELLKQADIVVTNPPFSLFREYVAQLVEHDKQFVIVGNQNAITYKEIFKLIKENKLWLGVDNGGTKWFQVPDDYDIQTESRKKTENGIKYFSMGSIMWYTNLDHQKRHETLILASRYNPDDYPHYDNYDAIEVSKVVNIPKDWDGAMGVPITFLDKYNPEQFEILGLCNDKRDDDDCFIKCPPTYLDEQHKSFRGFILNGKAPYARIVIKRKDTK